jgi:hypothetical protein
MMQILTVLGKERKPIRLAEVIMKVKGLRPATDFFYQPWISSTSKRRYLPEQNRVASGIAKRRVPNITFQGRVMLAMLNAQYPNAKQEYDEVKRMDVELAGEKEAIKEADKLYASFCRSIKRMIEFGLIEKVSIDGLHAGYSIPKEWRLKGFSYMISKKGIALLDGKRLRFLTEKA